MKTLSPFVKTILLVVLLAATLTACSPAQAWISPQMINTSMAVQIPLELKLTFNGFILFLVLFGLQWVFDLTKGKLDLRGAGVLVAGAVAEFLILQFQGLIDVIPAQYDLYVSLGLNVILAILTGLGFAQAIFHRERAAQLLGGK